MSRKSKSKGSRFERKICKSLSLWISNNEREDLFWRSAMSGGRATVALKTANINQCLNNKQKLSNQAGDISPIHPWAHKFTDKFYIECKHLKFMRFDSFLFGGDTGLANIWLNVVEEAKNYDKIPLFIGKENFKDIVLITSTDGMGYFMTWANEIIFDLERAYIRHIDARIYLYDEFISTVNPPNNPDLW